MVCAVNTVAGNSAQVGLASTKPDMHGLIPRCPYSRDYEGQVETVPTSGNSSSTVSAQITKCSKSDFSLIG